MTLSASRAKAVDDFKEKVSKHRFGSKLNWFLDRPKLGILFVVISFVWSLPILGVFFSFHLGFLFGLACLLTDVAVHGWFLLLFAWAAELDKGL